MQLRPATDVRHVQTALERTVFVASTAVYWALAIGVAVSSPTPWLHGRIPPGAAASIVALLCGMVGVVVAVLRRGEAARVGVDGPELVLVDEAGERRVPRSRIGSGVVVRRGARHDVDLSFHDGEVITISLDQKDAEALLAELQLTAAERRATFLLGDPAARRHVSLALAFVYLMITSVLSPALPIKEAPGWLVSAFVPVAAVLVTLAVNVAPRVEVGLDRVEIRRLFRTRRIPLERIEAAEEKIEYTQRAGRKGQPATVVWRRRLEIRLKDGETIHVRASGLSPFDHRLAAIAARIRQARAAREDLSHAADHAVLERRDESVRAWRERLARMLSGQADYRSATLTPEALSLVARNPEAPVEQRVGAALALGATRNPAFRRDVRIAADACVEPRLRVALREAVRDEPEEQVVLEALAEAEQHRS